MSPRIADDWPDEPDVAQPQRNPEDVRLRLLWASVLQRAVLDAKGHTGASGGGCGGSHSAVFWREHARAWFRGTDDNPGSFRWVCRTLGIDPAWVRRRGRV